MLPIIRSGINASMQEISVLTNNIANAGSIGFKRSQTEFSDIYMPTNERAGAEPLGLGTRLLDPRRQHGQGAFRETGGALDVAVNGAGMFIVQNPERGSLQKYTRDGAITLNVDGNLVTSDGSLYLDENQNPIRIPFSTLKDDGTRAQLSEVEIRPDGTIKASYGTELSAEIAKLGLAQFSDVTKLKSEGRNLFTATDASGEPRIGTALINGAGELQAGALEMSNVDMTTEMNFLVRAQQSFNGASRLMQTESDMVKRLIG